MQCGGGSPTPPTEAEVAEARAWLYKRWPPMPEWMRLDRPRECGYLRPILEEHGIYEDRP